MELKNAPCLISFAEACRLTGMTRWYMQQLRELRLVKTYRMVGGKHLYFRDSLLHEIFRNSEPVKKDHDTNTANKSIGHA